MNANKMKTPRTDGPLVQLPVGAVAPVEPEDLSRFEGEGGPEAPIPALAGVPLENAIGRRPSQAAHQADQNRITP